jgi:hypothetical protein
LPQHAVQGHAAKANHQPPPREVPPCQ